MATKTKGSNNISGNSNSLTRHETTVNGDTYTHISQNFKKLNNFSENIAITATVANIYRKNGHCDEILASKIKLDNGNLLIYDKEKQIAAIYATGTWTHFVVEERAKTKQRKRK